MDRLLLEEFTVEEVHTAIKNMHPTKAPGPDGIPALFYHKYWHIIGDDVVRFSRDVLNGKRDLGDVNLIHIVLIPKIKYLKCIIQFRPISPCNVLYKIVAKVLVNRFKNVLSVCISELQSALVLDRLI